jgi:retinol-binding protein 3
MRTVAALLLVSSTLLGQVPQGSPHAIALATPAGKVLSEWLEAVNSGDSTKLRAFYNRYQLRRRIGGPGDRLSQSGGLELISIEKSQPRYIEFVVKERATGQQAMGIMDLPAEGTPGLKQAALAGIPRGGSFADFLIDSARRANVIDKAIANLESDYVFPDLVKKMRTAVVAKYHRGEYNDITNGITFAARLTEDLRAVSNDKHLGVSFVPRLPGPGPQGPPPGLPRDLPPGAPRAPGGPRPTIGQECGFLVAVQPKTNVGIVKFNGFLSPDRCGAEATKVLDIVADMDALIFDLRENGGGDPAMVAYISSYLFDQRTHLNDLWTRRTNETDQYWTHDVPGRKYGGTKPVYVLTSSLTFSGAEEFTYNLKALKRATIIGEQTGGGAHPTRGMRIDEQFMIGVPFARAINPITKTNWEGTGVTPDVKVPAAQALETAKGLIAQKSKP